MLILFSDCFTAAVVAEWLRRLTRNQIPSGSAGSNPADCENFYFRIYKKNNALYTVHLHFINLTG